MSDVLLWFSFQLVLAAHLTANMSTSPGNEQKYFLTSTGEEEPSPSLHDPFSRQLSVVIPAYNEELRSESPGSTGIHRDPLTSPVERTHCLLMNMNVILTTNDSIIPGTLV